MVRSDLRDLAHAHRSQYLALLVLGFVLALLGLTGLPQPATGAPAVAPAAPPAPGGGVITNIGPITPTGQIAYTRNDTLAVMNADGSGQHNFINFADIDYNPAWSPDGKHLI